MTGIYVPSHTEMISVKLGEAKANYVTYVTEMSNSYQITEQLI